MVAVTVEGKNYELKRRMTRYELKLVENHGKKYGSLEELLDAGKQEEAEKLISSTTPEDEALIDMIVANCTGIQQEKVYKEMEFVHEVLLFGAILRESVPKKNLRSSSSPSEKPLTQTTSLPSEK